MEKENVILVVDDERNHADGMAEALEKYSAKVVTAYSGEDALDMIRKEDFDIVVTDLNLGSDIDGLAVLEQAKQLNSDTAVILVTAYATIETCKEAIQKGAYDYLVKPIDIDELRNLVESAGKKVHVSKEHKVKVAHGAKTDFKFQGVLGKTAVMEHIFSVLKRVSPTDISVLIEGESGTGKELIAKSVHDNSLRKNKPFRPVNCAGLTETLLESELFGHIKGAFTGATADRKGLFEMADKGTLFLDEIGDMPLTMQAKLLRVLEDGIVVPVGSNRSILVDVRVISATNHDLTELIEEKKFRQDLYFRIKGVSISLPALKDRVEDIRVFAEFFLCEAVTQTGFAVSGITEGALKVLSDYSWPGNIRQLRNCIRSMVVMCENDKLDVGDIPPEISQRKQLGSGSSAVKSASGVSLSELEKQAITDTLKQTGNNREKAAKILGIGERTLYRKIKEYGL